MTRHDPLENPIPLIRRVYAYVAFRIGDGPDAEDVTSDVFERALRYRKSYDPARGAPLPWLLGIARRCINDSRRSDAPVVGADPEESPAPGDLAAETVQRLNLSSALGGLEDRSRDLIALRFAADLNARQIGEVLGMKTNAVEVALHRALARLRSELESDDDQGGRRVPEPSPRASN